jgi:hypothetical protein
LWGGDAFCGEYALYESDVCHFPLRIFSSKYGASLHCRGADAADFTYLVVFERTSLASADLGSMGWQHIRVGLVEGVEVKRTSRSN